MLFLLLQDLKSAELKVTDVFVVLDREQGGVENLVKQGLNVHVLVSLSQILKTLCSKKKISETTVDEVSSYIKNSQIESSNISNGELVANCINIEFINIIKIVFSV